MGEESKSKKERVAKATQQLVEYHNSRRAYLAQVQTEFPVPDMAAAKDPKTLEYCIAQINQGVGWDELRRKLGLGPAQVDARWAEIRKHLFRQVVPDSPEQALVDAYTEQMEMTEHLREFLREVDAMIDRVPTNEEESKTQYQYYKLKLDTLKSLSEKNEARFRQFMDVKRLKLARKGTGFTINIISNTPRPSDARGGEARDVTPETKVIECKKK